MTDEPIVALLLVIGWMCLAADLYFRRRRRMRRAVRSREIPAFPPSCALEGGGLSDRGVREAIEETMVVVPLPTAMTQFDVCLRIPSPTSCTSKIAAHL